MSNKTILCPTKAVKITTDPENGTKQIRLNAEFFEQQGVTFNEDSNPVILEVYNQDNREIMVD